MSVFVFGLFVFNDPPPTESYTSGHTLPQHDALPISDAAKVMQICLRHDIRDMDGLEPFRAVVEADGTRRNPVYEGPQVRQISVPTTLSGGEFGRSEEHTSELQSLMRISYAVFCLKKKKKKR